MNLRLTLLASLFVIYSTTIAQEATPASRLAGIDTLLEKLLDDYKVAGFSVAVVHKDSVIYSKGFGYRDYGNRLPATPNTLYAIGSSTKAFTVALLGKLFEDSLSLDDKIREHLPNLRFQDGREEHVTVRDLIVHRTGLSRYDYSWYVFNSDARDSLLQRVKHMKPNADLRAKWQYNNFMYLAQGMIAERMTGKTWEENIKTHFLDPLGMKRSNFDVNVMTADTDASLGYTVTENDSIKKVPHFEIRGMGPAGSINSSVQEMASWLKVWVNGGKYGADEVIPAAYVQDAMSSHMVIGAGLPGRKHPDVHLSNYGLGWMIGSYRGHYQVEHGGNIDGFSASTAFFPSDSIGIVVLTNQNGSAVPGVVRNFVADRVLDLPFVNWNTQTVKKDTAEVDTAKQEDVTRIKGTRPTHALTDYTGTYEQAAYGKFTINLYGDTLKAIVGKQRIWLSHYHYDVFELKDIHDDGRADTAEGGIKVNFRTGLDGQVEGVAISLDDPSGDPVEFKRQPLAKEVSEEQLQVYVGMYELAGMRVKITVDNGVLFMDVPGQTNYETIAQGNHYFKLKILNGFAIRFEVDDASGKASAMYAIQPNGTFKATRVD